MVLGYFDRWSIHRLSRRPPGRASPVPAGQTGDVGREGLTGFINPAQALWDCWKVRTWCALEGLRTGSLFRFNFAEFVKQRPRQESEHHLKLFNSSTTGEL